MTMTAPADPSWLDVSAATSARLSQFAELVRKWSPRVNLVAKAALPDLWQRHILDSAQIFQLRPERTRHWVDLGSGGGFPGIVVAILALEQDPELRVTLVESDRRKCVFLLEAARMLSLAVTVRTKRIEDLTPQRADVVSARALAPLELLCHFGFRHLAPEGVALFQKGESAAKEVAQARLNWCFDLETFPSKTDRRGVTIRLRNIRHV